MTKKLINTPLGSVCCECELPNAPRSVLVLHGFASSRNSTSGKTLSTLLAQRSIGSLRIDFNGCGESYGLPSETSVTKMLSDAQASLDELAKTNATVGIYGSSMGGFIALLLASRNENVKAIVLRAPVSNFTKQWQRKTSLDEWRSNGSFEWKFLYGEGSIILPWSFYQDGAQYDALKEARKITAPVLVMHGDADETVPLQQSEELARQLPNCTLEKLRGESHQFQSEAHFERMARFFDEKL
ncbi:MAG: alpha/beta fold hydrolase [Candidatus Micrarchaeota archaeon]